ncbi:MAG: flagellar hook-associated protein FlgK [Xanthobacteraceae bacterium]|nr:flagellar hook-associated protein FlgK [Xanthobacteraceae bacterium]
MSLSQALATAMSGLRANQAALALVSSNVANAETPGYVKKTLVQTATTTADYGSSVRIAGVNRELDAFVQAQLRTETSGAAYANIRATFLNNLQSVYGDPNSTGTLESSFNALTTALQALSTSPDSQSARLGVVSAAQTIAQQLNQASQGVQTLRNSAENGLAGAVATANTAMAQIAAINKQLSGGQSDAVTASLLDQRDQYIDQLSQLMDIKVTTNDANQVSVFTTSGVQLVGVDAAQLSFNAQGAVTPDSSWDADPSKSTLGTLSITFPQGGSMDLIATRSIRSGAIAGYIELRDQTLVQAQAQLDQFAASLSSALSDQTVAGAPASTGAGDGFDLDLAGLQSGNVIHVSYKDNVTGLTHNLSIVRVDDPSVLPLPNSATNDPRDEVLGVDFSGGMASVVSQLNAALGSAGLQVSNPSGSTLRVLDDGAANRADVLSASTTKTVTATNSGAPHLALFTDGDTAYTGAISASGLQQTGLAARIAVNASLVSDPSQLVAYGASTASGDTTRPDFILSQLTTATNYYSPQTGIGTTNAPYKGTLLNYTQQFLGAQGNAAAAAQQLADGQSVVLSTLQGKMDAASGVNIDDEMAHLLALQNAYSANARVMSAVKDMYAMLLQAI